MTELEFETYYPRLFAEAVRITEENFEAVTDWCGGTVLTMAAKDKDGVEEIKSYIKIQGRRKDPRETQGFVGDWAAIVNGTVKFIENHVFNSSYTDNLNGIPLGNDGKFDDVSSAIYNQMIAEAEEAKKKSQVIVKMGPHTATITKVPFKEPATPASIPVAEEV